MTSETVVIVAMFIFAYCLTVGAIVCMKRANKRSRGHLGSDNISSSNAFIRYNDAYHAFSCRHIGCNAAPDPNTWTTPSRQRQWRRQHELAVARGHDRCRSEECSQCFALFGMTATELLASNSMRAPQRARFQGADQEISATASSTTTSSSVRI